MTVVGTPPGGVRDITVFNVRGTTTRLRSDHTGFRAGTRFIREVRPYLNVTQKFQPRGTDTTRTMTTFFAKAICRARGTLSDAFAQFYGGVFIRDVA